MPPLNSVIRRYTPPTCTLEIWAQSSPLSHLMGKTVIKQLTFELYFDAPQLPEESKILIRGDRDQLEILCDVVTNYVQDFLQQPADNFWLNISEPQDSSKVSHDSQFTDFQQNSLPSPNNLKSFSSQRSQSKIYLEPGNYLTHNLFLGPLANPTSGAVIQLSLLQIFDLATALDAYSADVMALPNLNHQHQVLRFPAWASIAAVMVLSVGLLPATWHLAKNNRDNQQQIATTSEPEKLTTALEPSPSLETPPLPPGLTPQAPLESTPQTPIAAFPQTPLAASNSSLFTPSSSPLPSLEDPLFISESKIPDIETNLSTARIPPTFSIQPDFTASIAGTENLPQRRSLPPHLSTNRDSLSQLSSPPLSPSITSSNGVRQSSLPSESLLTLPPTSGSINSSGNMGTEADSSVSRTTGQPATSETVAAGSSLFDTPQVAEARAVFQKRWQPPSGFTETLEYSLIVNADGTIERIYPINQAARIFFDGAGIPEIGQPFVSANRNGENVRIRVVLSPDGKVQTLPEN
ncbi:DUF4335 domain-containing protein [Nodularia chucula]|uniref:DUF4335 domain-containing protein n=1 Tax=Nodularia chucula TaxID=3093667 RepID=UPI0039C75F97